MSSRPCGALRTLSPKAFLAADARARALIETYHPVPVEVERVRAGSEGLVFTLAITWRGQTLLQEDECAIFEHMSVQPCTSSPEYVLKVPKDATGHDLLAPWLRKSQEPRFLERDLNSIGGFAGEWKPRGQLVVTRAIDGASVTVGWWYGLDQFGQVSENVDEDGPFGSLSFDISTSNFVFPYGQHAYDMFGLNLRFHGETGRLDRLYLWIDTNADDDRDMELFFGLIHAELDRPTPGPRLAP